MGKRVKPTSLLDEQPANVSAPIPDSTENEDVGSVIGHGRLTDKDKEKLEKYDALEKAVIELSKEKDKLESKIAEYAEKLSSVDSNEVATLKEKIASLEKELADAKSSSSEMNSLKKECKALRDEVDGYLMKISELTFENANLTCQLDELSKNARSNANVVNQSKFSPRAGTQNNIRGGLAQPNTDAYNPYRNNGYGTW